MNAYKFMLFIILMKFYLSSYGLGNSVAKLRKMMPKNKKTGFILNALDYTIINEIKIKERLKG